ncbi:MAG: DUF4962 domain-containing protein [Armatimonadetes bacterium]|nr:DUF4962 domain-containing protein [Armatimonadota bacterium]
MLSRIAVASAVILLCIASASCAEAGAGSHPRLYFNAEELARLRKTRTQGVRARIYRNLKASADWCLAKTPRTAWIAPVSPDPIYLNLYDRFYAMMQDMAIMEHLAFAYAYSLEEPYFEAGRKWTLSCCRIWRKEADGEPDANKAYAVMRLLKGVAVSYDLLYDRLSPQDRREIQETLASIGGKYYRWYLQNPEMAGPGQDKHHGSVEASSFGVAALALLDEVEEARNWLALMVKKHTDHLLPQALNPSGTQEQSSNFWASTMQYRIFFMDALRRVTGRDLFKEYRKFMDGRIALAAVACEKKKGYDQDQENILFAPSYGQLNYWSPVLLYLAREYRRPIYQRLALWDKTLGAIQETRYITANGEQLLFEMGGYAYAWYDSTVKPAVEKKLPRSFAFADVNEYYVRDFYRAGDIVAGIRLGQVIVHAGGRPVWVDLYNIDSQLKPATDVVLADNGEMATISCAGAAGTGHSRQTLELKRPGLLRIRRQADRDVQWWCYGRPVWKENNLTWPGGTRLTVTKGTIVSLDPEGYRDEKIVGMGKLKLVDPMPTAYPLVTVRPENGELVVEIRRKGIEETDSSGP